MHSTAAYYSHNETVMKAASVLNHPQYNGNTLDYDYAIVTLSEDVPELAVLEGIANM